MFEALYVRFQVSCSIPCRFNGIYFYMLSFNGLDGSIFVKTFKEMFSVVID